MGAALLIPIVLVVLAAVIWVVWSLFAAGSGAVATARSVSEDNSSETAAHSDERTNIRTVETTAEQAENNAPQHDASPSPRGRTTEEQGDR